MGFGLIRKEIWGFWEVIRFGGWEESSREEEMTSTVWLTFWIGCGRGWGRGEQRESLK